METIIQQLGCTVQFNFECAEGARIVVVCTPRCKGGVCEYAGEGTEEGWSSLLCLRLGEPPRLGAGGEILCRRRRCLARASERVKDLSHAVIGLKPTSSRKNERYRCYIPGRGHVNGSSPVWERMWDMSAKRDV